MPLWVIESVGDNPRSWSGSKGGTNLSYRVKVKSKDGSKQPPRDSDTYANVELVQKESTAAPTVGQEIEGTVDLRPWETKDGEKKEDLKFNKPRGAGYGGGGGGRAWKPRPDDSPLVYVSRQAMIGTQHSQDMALRVLELAQRLGTDDWGGIMADLGVEIEHDGTPLGLVAAFQRQVNMAGAAAWKSEEENSRLAKALAAIQ